MLRRLRTRRARAVWATGVLVALAAAPVAAQVSADTLRADTLAAEGGEAAPADSAAADSVFHNLPQVGSHAPAGWARGVWEWDASDIMASGANTLVELLRDVPGLLPLRGGDYGTPLALTGFGGAGGWVRVLRDGFELVPLAGSVPDLSRIGLAGVSRVRAERGMGGLVVRLTSYVHEDARPFSRVEAGTGDLDTNIFRGTFADPAALGGSVGLALERTDTRGPGGDEVGNRNGSWLRYQFHRGDGTGLAVDFRRMGTETQVDAYAAKVTRTDWLVRGRTTLAPGVVAEAYAGRSTHRVEDVRDRYAREGGTRSQQGLRVGRSGERWGGEAAYRRFGGPGLPSGRMDLTVHARSPRFGGVQAAWERAAWPGRTTSAARVGAWTEPLLGVSLFASMEDGSRGVRAGPVADLIPADTTGEGAAADSTTDTPIHVVDGHGTRLGVRASWRGAALSAALLRVEADSLLPTGLEFDRGAPALPGGTRRGWEAQARLPVPVMPGLTVEGSFQQWQDAWPYLPRRIYRGAFAYHRTFLASGNLELWWRVGVRGRDPMEVRVVSAGSGTEEDPLVLERVPFDQSWYGTIQVRVVSVRVFIGWENFTIRRNLQDVPGRVLPATRAFYGIRWDMRN